LVNTTLREIKEDIAVICEGRGTWMKDDGKREKTNA